MTVTHYTHHHHNDASSRSSLIPSMQQQQSSSQGSPGMRAVFHGNPGIKRECAGTKVFLPRQLGARTESRKKPGLSQFALCSLHLLGLGADSQSVFIFSFV
ncbi:TIP41-LIKE PROTEIN [Salix viminalis]|uniref:TIP41-LIKE PROTEIN n=1 Tax=Salix viminalis TaxID=40686 RepID=A0A9Q0UGT8_SALVM|nr:TIP41-LIKE PROTEIN [Salix viminalis]